MQWIQTLMLVVQVLSALAIIILVLLQHGKGADMGAAFGSGSAGSMFGSAGSANALSRATAVCAAVFFACTLGLAYAANHRSKAPASGGVMSVPAQTAPAVPGGATAPAVPGTAPAAPASKPDVPAATEPAAAPAQPSGQAPAQPAAPSSVPK